LDFPVAFVLALDEGFFVALSVGLWVGSVTCSVSVVCLLLQVLSQLPVWPVDYFRI
jgi:hypothetical protein